MSGVSLTAATRQNLLSLQDTASLTATTQNRLSTGKKVSSALDNPVNFFTSQSLSNRSATSATCSTASRTASRRSRRPTRA